MSSTPTFKSFSSMKKGEIVANVITAQTKGRIKQTCILPLQFVLHLQDFFHRTPSGLLDSFYGYGAFPGFIPPPFLSFFRYLVRVDLVTSFQMLSSSCFFCRRNHHYVCSSLKRNLKSYFSNKAVSQCFAVFLAFIKISSYLFFLNGICYENLYDFCNEKFVFFQNSSGGGNF